MSPATSYPSDEPRTGSRGWGPGSGRLRGVSKPAGVIAWLGIVALAACLNVPGVLPVPVARAATCTGWSSTVIPPSTINVLLTGSGVVETVDFETYTKKVVAAEWPSTWPVETLKAGAVAVKQYAWYKALHPRSATGGCYDVRDDSYDQYYSPSTPTTANHILAVESTWDQSVLKDGAFILTSYGPGGDVPCGSDHTGWVLKQQSARRCGLNGMKWGDILLTYYSPGGSIQNSPTLPGPPTAVSAIPGNGYAQVTWSAPESDGNSKILSYTATSGPDGKTCTATSGTSCYVEGLSNGSAYTFTVTARNYVGDGPASAASAPVTPVAPPPATYHPLTPARILDSRTGTGLSGAFSSHVARTFSVWGAGGVPTEATAVTGNLTVTGQTSRGFLYAGPVPVDNPTSSTLNFPAGDDRANAVTVALSSAGTLSITYAAPTAGPSAQVIFDVTGFFSVDANGATYRPLVPARILDTRASIGIAGALGSHVAQSFPVRGAGGVPAEATAVTGNLTVTAQQSLGFLYIGPEQVDNPTSSTLNFPAGDDRANAVTVALSPDGRLWVTYAAPTLGPSAQVIFDVTGYFAPGPGGSAYVPLNPTRILDTRNGTGGLGALSSHTAAGFAVWGAGGVPADSVAVSGNLTVTAQTSLGFLYVGPAPANNPTSSTLNFPRADDRANAVTVALSPDGYLYVTYAAPTNGPTTQAIFDVTGYFAPVPR